jgi:hypothetical protein
MKWIFLTASPFCGLMTLLFFYVGVFYVLNRPLSVWWRVVALVSVVMLCTILTRRALLRFQGRQIPSGRVS